MDRHTYFKDFQRTGGLTRKKLREYVPTMIMTNLSVLLLISVDGLVVGNFDGMDALSSVNIFYPVTLTTGALAVMTAVGISTSLSTAMGENDLDRLDYIRGISLRLMIIMAVAIAIIQIPVVWLMIRSYRLDAEMYALTWQYAIGLMICTPLSLMSAVGTYQLQIAGRMKVLMRLSVMESIANLVFDLLFVGAFHMGVAGAGYGSAVANLLRCSFTVIYLARYTDMYKSSKRSFRLNDMLKVLGCGAPDGAYQLVGAFQSYCMMQIILSAFGQTGGAVKGVCTFTFSITNVFIGGIVGGMRPLTGLLTGADDKKGLRTLMRQGLKVNLIGTGIATVVVLAFPAFFYVLHGVKDIPDGGLLSVRLFALHFIIAGCNSIFRMYLTNRKDSRFATILTVAGNATLPVFAFILLHIAKAPFIFLSYLITELIVFMVSSGRYKWWTAKDKEELNSDEELVLYMTVRPDQAVDASRAIRDYAEEKGVDRKAAYRAALCMEEMVAYVKEVGKAGADRTNVEIMVRFKKDKETIFVCLDDGECISLDKDSESQKLITDNYGLLKKLATSVEYQYLLNMNYTRIIFAKK